jgi:hypothetical protein
VHEEHEIEKKLRAEASRISAEFGGAPVVVLVGGSEEANIPRVMTGSCIKGADVRLRDLLGILQTAIQIESWKHFRNWK